MSLPNREAELAEAKIQYDNYVDELRSKKLIIFPLTFEEWLSEII